MTTDGLLNIFKRVLETDDVQVDSDFFAMGGDSLLATRVLSAIARESGIELAFTDFANDPSPKALSMHLSGIAQ